MQLLTAFTKFIADCPKHNPTTGKSEETKTSPPLRRFTLDPELLDLYKAIDVRG